MTGWKKDAAIRRCASSSRRTRQPAATLGAPTLRTQVIHLINRPMPGGLPLPFWPPAGVVLAGLLCFGRAVLPGLIIGTLLLFFDLAFYQWRPLPILIAPRIMKPAAASAITGTVTDVRTIL